MTHPSPCSKRQEGDYMNKLNSFPFIEYLIKDGKPTGCRFYPEEVSREELSGCDTCDNDAEYMTCPEPEEDLMLYICEDCIKKYHLQAFIDGKYEEA